MAGRFGVRRGGVFAGAVTTATASAGPGTGGVDGRLCAWLFAVVFLFPMRSLAVVASAAAATAAAAVVDGWTGPRACAIR